MIRRSTLLALLLPILCAAPALAQSGPAPGAPGQKAVWTEADKDGFGSATHRASRTWLTLDDGRLTEVYYPDLGTPALRDLQFVVSDGRTFSEREQDSTRQRVRLLDSRSLTYRQVNTDRDGRYRIVKTYTTDPARSSVLVQVRFQSLSRRPLRLYVLHDPALSNNGDDDNGATRGGALVAWDARAASALVSSRRFTRTSSGFLGSSDGWTDLRADNRMNWAYDPATGGNVVQTARTALNGLRRQDLTLALGFGADRQAALSTARASLGRGFLSANRAYRRGWHDYIGGLKRRPASARPFGPAYWVSAMVMAASEDKINRGAHIASPSMPWAWGLLTLDDPSAAYHLVWPRDLYQVATAQIALGDTEAAGRRSTSPSSASRSRTARSPRTRGWTGPRSGRTCSSTRWPCRSCWPGSCAGSTRPPTGSTSGPRRTSSPRRDPRRRRSAGRTRRDGHPGRSRPRSPAS